MSETNGKKWISYGDKKFPMDGYTLDQAKQIMARHFPELADPDVKTEKSGDDTIYTFTKKAGRKGCALRLLKGAKRTVPTSDIQRALRQVKPAHIPPALISVALARVDNTHAEFDGHEIEALRAEAAAVDALHDRLRDIAPAVALDGEALL